MIREAINTAREEQGVSIAALAVMSGISRPNVSRYLGGLKDLQGASLDRLCESLGLELVPRKSRAARKGGTARRGRDD